VSFSSTLNGVPVTRLVGDTTSKAGLVDSLSKQEAALNKELEEYSQMSIAELYSALAEQQTLLLSAAQKDLLVKLLSVFPSKLSELCSTKQLAKLLSVLDNLDSFKQPLQGILKTESRLSEVLLHETVLQMVLHSTPLTKGVRKEVVECDHPYADCMNTDHAFGFPGAERLIIEFDPQCHTESGFDFLRFYTEPGHNNQVFQGTGNSGWNRTEVEGSSLYVNFYSDGSRVEWGYRFIVTPVYKKRTHEADPLQHRANLDVGLWILEQVLLSHSELPVSLERFIQKAVLSPLTILMFTNTQQQTRALSLINQILTKAQVTPYTQQVVNLLASEAARLHSGTGATSTIAQELFFLLLGLQDKFMINIKAKWFHELCDAFDSMKGLVHRTHHIQPALFEQFKEANQINCIGFLMSGHPYSLKPCTKEYSVEGADSLDIEFDEESSMQPEHTVIFTSDSEAKHLIDTGPLHSLARWASNPRGPDIAFSNNNLTVTRTNSSGLGNAVWDTPITTGVTKITLRIDSGESDCLCIGVWRVIPSYPLTERLNSSNASWGWNRNGEMHQPGINRKQDNLNYNAGDTIGLLIDMGRRTLTCSKAGYSCVLTDLAEAVVPVICFGGSNQIVSIVSVELVEKLSKKCMTLEGSRFFYHYPANSGCLFTTKHTWRTKDVHTSISTDKLTARRTEGDHRSTISSNLVLAAAKYYVELLIKEGSSGLEIGFVPDDFECSKSLASYTTAVYLQDGTAVFQTSSVATESFGVGDRVGAYLDMQRHQVAFFKNGVEVVRHSVDFSASTYYFMVSLNAKGQEVSFTQNEAPDSLDLTGLNTGSYAEACSTEWGFRFKVTPKLNGSNKMMGLRTLTEKQQELWREYLSEQTKCLSRQVLEEVVAYTEEICIDQGKNPLQLQPEDFNPKPEELLHYTALEKLTIKEIQECFRLVKYFNKQVNLILPLISLDFTQPNTLQRLFLAVRGIIFAQMKATSFNEIISKTDNSARPSITIDRTKSMRAADTGRVDNEGLFSIFGQISRLLSQEDLRNSDRAFHVTFLGEGASDAGGPYNEVISNIADELQSKMLPLFVPVQNQVHAIGEYRDSWTVNPSATGEGHMNMYLFLGKMMGVSIRTKNNLNFRFPPIFWKHLVMDEVTLHDLKSTDECCFQMLEILRNLSAHRITADNFSETFEGETMTTKDSSGRSVPVIEGGETQPLTYERVAEYADLVEHLRLTENEEAYRQIRRGISIVVPLIALNLFSWKQIETMVCGAPDVSVDILKRNTEYNVDEQSPHVKFLWEVLAAFTPKERSLFLRFVWGRSRLPASCDFRKFRISGMHPVGNIDHYLPVSHTCFFTLDLPAYTSRQVMHDKLLYAITHCRAIDLDNIREGGWEED
jgi:hypothetical protein